MENYGSKVDKPNNEKENLDHHEKAYDAEYQLEFYKDFNICSIKSIDDVVTKNVLPIESKENIMDL